MDPTLLTIEDGAYAMDGGSIYLAFRDSDGVRHGLVLVQHGIPLDKSDPRMPGRLYLDDRIIPFRSEEETRLLSEIKTARISPVNSEQQQGQQPSGRGLVIGDDISTYLAATRDSSAAAIQWLVDSLVQFVESDEYVQLASEFKDESSV